MVGEIVGRTGFVVADVGLSVGSGVIGLGVGGTTGGSVEI